MGDGMPMPGQVLLAPAVRGVHIVTFVNICVVSVL